MKLKIIIIILACFVTSFVNAQKNPIEYRFKNGEKGLLEFLAKNVEYPYDSYKNNSIGYSITEISISPSGEISHLKTVNSIDEQIDKEIFRVLRSTKKYWLPDDTISKNQNFYVQVVFMMSEDRPDYRQINPVHRPSFLEPVVITAMKNGMIPETDEALANQSSEFLKKNEFEKSLDLISKLIRRNPFNKDLYQLRIAIYKRTNQSELLDNDIKKIADFADGCSLDQLLSTEN